LAAQSYVTESGTSDQAKWEDELRRLFNSASPIGKIAIVGLGHRFRADDYVGSYIAKSLAKCSAKSKENGVYVFNAEESVEKIIRKLIDIAPKHVVFLDACEMHATPGEIRFLSIEETSYPFFTTHGIPLKLLAHQFLAASKVWIVAIQPASLELDEHLTGEVDKAASLIISFVTRNLMEASCIA